ncbi:MAG: GNAT family protein [Mobilicoccus sp.]|nr:GNAT family protein [Mobilicoccus sp.]
MEGTNEFGQPVGRAVAWGGAQPLAPLMVQGRTVALAPLDPVQHLAGLWEAFRSDPAAWTYLPYEPPASLEELAWILDQVVGSGVFAPHVITDTEGTPLGMASYLRTQPDVGSAEIGFITYGAALRRSTAATEAMTLLAAHVFASGYRRYEWKCDALNAASRTAALRLGFRFEGVWRNALVTKGRNRDTAWYAMTDDDWTRLAPVHEAWLMSAAAGEPAFRLSEATAALWNVQARGTSEESP